MADIGKYGKGLYEGYLRGIERLGLAHLKGSPVLIGLLGLLVSFLGSLPIGVLNVTSLYWSTTAGLQSALGFALAVVAVEGLWAFGALYFSRNLKIEGKWKTAMLLVTFVLLSYLSYATYQRSFTSMDQMQVQAGVVSLNTPWMMGLVLSSLNPFQVPFWLLWHTFFREQGWLTQSFWNQGGYVVSIAIGSFLALGLYALLGAFLQKQLQDVISDFQRILAVVFALFALYFLYAGYRHSKNLTQTR